jgi:hypothetical protein
MTNAYLTPPKGIKVANGGKMQHGMIIGGSDTMNKNPQRGLNTACNIARDGKPKRPVVGGVHDDQKKCWTR